MSSTAIVIAVIVFVVLALLLFLRSGKRKRVIVPPQDPKSAPTGSGFLEGDDAIRATVTKPPGSGPASKNRGLGVTVGVERTDLDGVTDEMDLLKMLGDMSDTAAAMLHIKHIQETVFRMLDDGYEIDDIIRYLEALAKNTIVQQSQRGTVERPRQVPGRSLRADGPAHDPWRTDS